MKKILITSGDPAGIGPYLVVKTLTLLDLSKYPVTVIGSEAMLSKFTEFKQIASKIKLINVNLSEPVSAGIPSAVSGKAALKYIDKAIALLKEDKNCSLVTAPVSKEAIKKTVPDFSGHTEYLAEKFSVNHVAMLMKGQKLKVVFLTRHLLLRNVSENLSQEDIQKTLALTLNSLLDNFNITQPKIAVCSFNPHAGIDTFLDREEKIILQAVNNLNQQNQKDYFTGPYPSDTLFSKAVNHQFDLVAAVYHDQGMIPFKLFEFSRGVNLTLGLPFIRTSPAHGTAFDLVNQPQKIDCRSMQEAIITAGCLNHQA